MNDRIEVASAFRDLDPNQSLGQGVAASFPIIGIKGKVWSLRYQGETYYFTRDDDGTPLPYIDVVILGENPNVSKTYYPGTYQEDSNNAPTCAATNGDVPDPGVPIPQSQTCGTCKRNVWTVLENGRKGQECKDNKRVAVLLIPAMTAKILDAPLLEPCLLRVPGGSLRALKTYGDSLKHRGAHSAAVVTRISFDREQQFQMKFEVKQPLTNNEAPVIRPLLKDQQTQTVMGTQPAIYEARQLPSQQEERIETGIMSAFGKQSRQDEEATARSASAAREIGTTPAIRRGRPPGSTNKPKPRLVEPDGSPDEPPWQEVEPQTAPRTVDAMTDPPEEVVGPSEVPYQEADPSIDATLQKVMAEKAQNMLK